MEAAFFSFMTSLVTKGILGPTALIIVIILILCGLSFYLLRPMYKNIKNMPSKTDINELIQSKREFDKYHITEVKEKLNKVLEIMDKIDNVDENNYREVKEIRRDIETVKQILNQFQGHMMYSRSNELGNRELK